jgi:hypothetical protein
MTKIAVILGSTRRYPNDHTKAWSAKIVQFDGGSWPNALAAPHIVVPVVAS